MMVSPKKIVWPTDFSPLSLKAASYARGFCDVFGSALHVVYAAAPPVETALDGFCPSPLPAVTLPPKRAEALRCQLAHFCSEALSGLDGITMAPLVGTPWLAICDYAKSIGADLIVIGTHGHSGFKHILMGSVAERVVQHAPCPVLVVKSIERDFTIEDGPLTAKTGQPETAGLLG